MKLTFEQEIIKIERDAQFAEYISIQSELSRAFNKMNALYRDGNPFANNVSIALLPNGLHMEIKPL